MPKVHTQVARKDYPNQGIKAGQKYYKWQCYGGPIQKSKTYPNPWELTRSSFKSTLYQMQATQWSCYPEELEEQIEKVKQEVEMLKEEAESALENMPEHLQELSDSGMLLQERIEGMEEVYTGLDEQAMEVADLLQDDELSEEESSDRLGEIFINLDVSLSCYSE